ncbi:MMPL family transporter [Pseudidiomarina sp. E22-M8]|uniref:MMPL family transporter n=1 Tax=Pseudidiomarina sp. E22-M8 TaxID=3424768 RepID=UPI00403C91D1
MWRHWLTYMVIGLAALLGLFAYQVQTSSWQSSLLDTLPESANPYHRAYQASQQPNEQQILVWLQVPAHDAVALRKAVKSGLLELATGQPEVTTNSQLALAPMLDFYRAHSGSLATATDREKLDDHPQQLITGAQLRLQQPAPILVDLTTDPLLLTQRYVEQLPDLMPGFRFDEPFYVRESEHYELLVALTSGADALSQSESQQVVQKIEQFTSQLQHSFGALELARSGLVFHASAAANQAKAEMTWFGGLSLVMVVLLFILVFRSLRHLLFTVLVISVAGVVGFTAVMLLFAEPHVLMLVFATTLIGLCIDYVFHATIAASHDARSWHAVVPALWLGGLTTIVGYALLVILPLPLLQQLGVFMATALLCVLVMVIYLTPRWRAWKAPVPGWQRLHQRTARLYNFNQLPAVPWLLVVFAAVLASSVLYQQQSNDSVRQLASSPATLLDQEQLLREKTQAYFDADVLLIKADNEAELIAAYAEVAERLPQWQRDGLIGRWQSLFDYVLAPSQQRALITAQQALWQRPEGTAYLQWLGLDAPTPATANSAAHPLYSLFVYPMAKPQTAASPASGYLGVVRLAGITDRAALANELRNYPAVELYNPLLQASSALGDHRHQLQLWLIGLLVLATALLSWRLRRRQPWPQQVFVSLQVIAVITIALSAALLVAMLSQALNVFHWVGAILVLVLGLDYGIFCASDVRREHALQAISLSALTTAIAFGALSFSATPAIAAFGGVVLVGVLVSALFAPCIKQFQPPPS